MGAHTDSLQIAENSDSENDEADADNAAVSDATAAADNSPTDGEDDCEVCLVAARDNSIALVPCGHRRFCLFILCRRSVQSGSRLSHLSGEHYHDSASVLVTNFPRQ